MLSRRHFLYSLWVVLGFWGLTAQAQDAGKTLHMVVPFPAGGSADIVARVIAKPLALLLNQPVMVDNKPGADGAIAAEYVAQAAPDGQTLFFATYGAMSAVPALHKQVHYDVVKDFTPVIGAGQFSFFVFTHPDVHASNILQLIDYAHKHPGALSYGTGNVGAIVASADLTASQHMNWVHVPYKGEVPAMTDFLAGRIQMMIGTPSNALNWVKEGRLNALVTLADKRSPLLPNVPTMAEMGLHTSPTIPWAGVFGPAQMSPQRVKQLNQAINQVLIQPEVLAEFAKQGFEAQGSTPEQLAAQVKSQLAVWGKSIQLAGLHAE
jgi:tripartite-type tricarboxylate transporter receptor subunit TctC